MLSFPMPSICPVAFAPAVHPPGRLFPQKSSPALSSRSQLKCQLCSDACAGEPSTRCTHNPPCTSPHFIFACGAAANVLCFADAPSLLPAPPFAGGETGLARVGLQLSEWQTPAATGVSDPHVSTPTLPHWVAGRAPPYGFSRCVYTHSLVV